MIFAHNLSIEADMITDIVDIVAIISDSVLQKSHFFPST